MRVQGYEFARELDAQEIARARPVPDPPREIEFWTRLVDVE